MAPVPSGGVVAVTGAAGFVGGWVVRRLLERGYRVRACVRNTADPTRLHVFFTAASLSMTMAGSATFHGSVFNPGGGLTMTGGSTPAPTFFGVFHGTTMSTTSTALFRADASFGSTTSNTNLLGNWRQTQ